MKPKLDFVPYIIKMTCYSSLAVAGLSFGIIAFFHLLMGYVVWGMMLGFMAIIPTALVGVFSGALSGILSSFMIFIFLKPVYIDQNKLLLFSSLVVAIASMGLGYFCWVAVLKSITTTGEISYLGVFLLTAFSTIIILVVNYSVLQNLFTSSRKQKERS